MIYVRAIRHWVPKKVSHDTQCWHSVEHSVRRAAVNLSASKSWISLCRLIYPALVIIQPLFYTKYTGYKVKLMKAFTDSCHLLRIQFWRPVDVPPPPSPSWPVFLHFGDKLYLPQSLLRLGFRARGTPYVGRYVMLGYTWVVFEKISVLFPWDGYLFSTKFLYFFCKVGIYFEENSYICRARSNPFTRNFLYFIPQSWCNLHIKFLYISARWKAFQEILL